MTVNPMSCTNTFVHGLYDALSGDYPTAISRATRAGARPRKRYSSFAVTRAWTLLEHHRASVYGWTWNDLVPSITYVG
ncbi:hypothetical protein AB0K18_05215 [Nonomuraea sp. NPDC049421]|uniref:hypothetical protein n=1 Tax=Nonomuraea sp. NPDC049421 TaxID=3155275 RepID=UPI0034309811